MPRGVVVSRRPSAWRQLDSASRYAWPAATCVLGLFLLGLPLGLPGQAGFRPVFCMAWVYFWSLYRPSSMPAPVVALLGLLLDLLGFSPIGLWAVLLLLLQGATQMGRRPLLRAGFLIHWLVFCAFACAGAVLAWGVQGALYLTLLPVAPVALQVLAAMALYPALALLLTRAHRGAAAAELA